MKNAQELIDAIKNVPSSRFNQRFYCDYDKDNNPCGCVMLHFELFKFGKRNISLPPLDYKRYFSIDSDAYWYIFGDPMDIQDRARKREWPLSKGFTVQSAIERIKFIDNLTKDQNERFAAID